MEDISTASAEAPGPSRRFEKMAEFVDKMVFSLLKEGLGDKVEVQAQVVNAQDMEGYDDPSKLQEKASEIKVDIKGRIRVCYRLPEVTTTLAADVAKKTVDALIKQFGSKPRSSIALTQKQFSQLETAFTKTEYVGDAHIQFGQYLRRCWKVYDPKTFKAPYATVVQSSGFGKSRMLSELAKIDGDGNMRILYICARKELSTGYPEATPTLREWLFKEHSNEEEIAERLKAMFYYAEANWETVHNEWLGLFTQATNDVAVANALSAQPHRTNSVKGDTKNPDSKMVVLVIDEARCLIDEQAGSGINRFRQLRKALVLANQDIGADGGIFGVLVDTNSRISDLSPPWISDPSFRFTSNRAALFPPFVFAHTLDANWRRYCRDNTRKQHSTDMEEKKEDDTDAEEEDGGLLPAEDEIAMYKRVVTEYDGMTGNPLIQMGRPLWYTTYGENPEEAFDIAASKLMLGMKGVYNEETMFGVASMLCRLGVRPYSTSALASRAVADFMSILAYVNYERDGYLSSYASDPVLTLGAIKVWYGAQDCLAKFILPQLQKLIFDETLDTGGVGEVVARILLLLAMDKCVLGDGDSVDYKNIGQFITVSDFLGVLAPFEDTQIYAKGMKTVSDEQRVAYSEWRSKWGGWKVGFTHFVQLYLEPSEDTLWCLLGRRAAGIFPRNQDGADLIIPIVKKNTKYGDEMTNKVSFILVQVKNRYPNDSTFSQSATKKLSPLFVFGGKAMKSKKSGKRKSAHPKGKQKSGMGRSTTLPAASRVENLLSRKPISDMIRIYMSVREEDCSTDRLRFIYATSLDDKTDSSSNTDEKGEVSTNDKDAAGERECGGDVLNHEKLVPLNSIKEGLNASKTGFTLCFRSISRAVYPFLRDEVSARLEDILEPSWNPMERVNGDLKRRAGAEITVDGVPARVKLSDTMSTDALVRITNVALAPMPGFDREVAETRSAASSSNMQFAQSRGSEPTLPCSPTQGNPTKRTAGDEGDQRAAKRTRSGATYSVT